MNNFNEMSDIILIKNIKDNGCGISFEELINRYEKIYYTVVQKFCAKHPDVFLNDYTDDLYIVFNEVINKFNPNKKTKFSTFLFYSTRYHCLNTYKKVKQEISHENQEIDLIQQENNQHYTFKDNLEEINDLLLKHLDKLSDKRISKIFYKRFIDLNNNKLTPWSAIGQELNLSTTMIITLFQRGQKYLYQKLYKEKNKII